MFKQIGKISSLLRDARDLSGRMKEMSDQLASKRVTGTAGGGMIQVEANGHGEVLRVKIDPTVANDREMIEDLLPAAINQASSKARELGAEMVQSVAGTFDVAGLKEALAQITGQPPE